MPSENRDLSGSPHVHQINLQPGFGGGERYTRFFTRALLEAGCRITLYVHARANTWNGLAHPALSIVRLSHQRELMAHMPADRGIVMTHVPLDDALLRKLAERHYLVGFAHMPLAERGGEGFRRHALVVPVSAYVRETLRMVGIVNSYPEPLYGISEFDCAAPGSDEPIVATSPRDWDKRKFRDRVLSWLHPAYRAVAPRPVFHKRPGLTLGIVSALGPIKQFPLLFQHLSPILAGFAGVNLEIFGRGGYSYVRDMRAALAPIRGRVRFWGFQEKTEIVYPQIDWLLSGLPEKEALGLNLVEAQACGTPVLAVNAPPFTETVLDGKSGFLYRDPREDAGADFRRVLERIVREGIRPDPREAVEHLQRFRFPALVGRTRRLIEHIAPLAQGAPR